MIAKSSPFKVNNIIFYVKELDNITWGKNLNLGQIYKAGRVFVYHPTKESTLPEDIWMVVVNKKEYNCERFIKYSDRNKPENREIMLELVKKRLIGE